MQLSAARFQPAFADALTDPARPVPVAILDRTETRRFDVYRNNVAMALIGALRLRFPVVARLVGDAFFGAMARVYALSNLPETPLLFAYGDGFPDFVETFEPAAALPYLADVARLEVACSRAYHAADATPLDVDALGRLPAEAVPEARLRFHPSLALVTSAHPVASIWAAHQTEGDDVTPPPVWVPEAAVVLRPHALVEVHRLQAGVCAFAASLAAGATLGEAAQAALSVDDGFDFGRATLGLFALGAVVALDPRPFGGGR
ncbi:MAG: putative DNA-binding domain-containing protein [Alphaproteobacteria bacterium]